MPYKLLKHINWPVLMLALCMATGMWYTVTIRDRLEAQLDIRLDYKKIPDNLVVTDGLINQVRVRLRGPEALVRGINPQNLFRVMDLSRIKQGNNIIPLVADEWGAALRAFEVVEVSPPRLNLLVDKVSEQSLTVMPQIKSPLQNSVLDVQHLQVTPPTVTVRGPDGLISTMKNIPLVIKLDPRAAAGAYNQILALDLPGQVTASPASVKVSYTIASTRKQISLERPVTIDTPDKRGYTATPTKLLLFVEVPEALIRNSVYLNKVSVSVTPPPLDPGGSAAAPVRFDLPEGMTLVAPQSADITVTRNKK